MAFVPLVFLLQNYKSSTKEVSGWKQRSIETESVIEHGIWFPVRRFARTQGQKKYPIRRMNDP